METFIDNTLFNLQEVSLPMMSRIERIIFDPDGHLMGHPYLRDFEGEGMAKYEVLISKSSTIEGKIYSAIKNFSKFKSNYDPDEVIVDKLRYTDITFRPRYNQEELANIQLDLARTGERASYILSVMIGDLYDLIKNDKEYDPDYNQYFMANMDTVEERFDTMDHILKLLDKVQSILNNDESITQATLDQEVDKEIENVKGYLENMGYRDENFRNIL